MTDLLVVALIGSVVLVAGIGLGILVARRLSRMIDNDEDHVDD